MSRDANARSAQTRERLAAPISFGLGIFTGQSMPGACLYDEYQDVLDIIEAADALGFDAAWISEHQGADDGYFPALTPMLAAAAARTRQIILGSALLLPALYHPFELAEELALIDQLSEGRVVAGLGLGWRRREFDSVGISFNERLSRCSEAVAHLRHLWSGSQMPKPRYYSTGPLAPHPIPYQSGGPPIFMPGVAGRSIRRAALSADGMFISRSGPNAACQGAGSQQIDDALSLIDEVRGPGALPFPIVLLVNVFVDTGDPWAVIGPGVSHQFATYARWQFEDKGMSARPVDIDDAVAMGRRLVIAGPPELVAERLVAHVAPFVGRGPVHLALKVHYPGVGARRTISAVRSLAENVIPVVESCFVARPHSPSVARGTLNVA